MASYNAAGRGKYGLLNSFDSAGRGIHRLLNSFTSEGKGCCILLNLFNAAGRGIYKVSFRMIGRGTYKIPFRMIGRGKFNFLIFILEQSRGFSRIANDALAQYELYRGVNDSPNFDSDPWETFTSLPHESAAFDPDHTYHFVLRKRNAWGLVSQNIAEWVVTIDASGNQDITHPSAPQEITAEADAGGKIRVRANYHYLEDEENQATKFLVYLTSDGSDPNPDTDEPTEVTMSKTDGIAKLNWLSSAYADETTIKVLIRTRRVDAGPTNVDSVNSDIYSVETDTDGPAKPEPAGIFFGKIIEQRQVN